jgi:hypothetical protein
MMFKKLSMPLLAAFITAAVVGALAYADISVLGGASTLPSGGGTSIDANIYDRYGAAAGCVDGGCPSATSTNDGIMTKVQAQTVANVTAPNVGTVDGIAGPTNDAGPSWGSSRPVVAIRGGTGISVATTDNPNGSNTKILDINATAASASAAGSESAAQFSKVAAMFDTISKIYDQTTNGSAKAIDGGIYTTALGASDHFSIECGVKRQDVDAGSPFCTGHYGREGECTNVDGGVLCQSGNFPATDPESTCAASDNVSLAGAAGGWSIQIQGTAGQTNNWECVVKMFTMP